MFQVLLTPAGGKRLIAKGIVQHPVVQAALHSKTVVIVAGTTNGYVAEEMFSLLGYQKEFNRKRFFRGITVPPSQKAPGIGECPGDVVVVRGEWLPGKTIFDVTDDLKQGDVIVKGANALDIAGKRAGILIGDSRGGTIIAALKAVVGRRVHLLIPVGLEKRIPGDLDDIARRVNASGVSGPRLLPVTGEVFTEIEALRLLSGATATIMAGGGVCGAEGSVWLLVEGTAEEERRAREVINSVADEPPFSFEEPEEPVRAH